MNALTRALDHRRAALVVALGGLALRLAWLASLGSRPLVDDARDYHQMALLLARGERFEPDWPPGVPWLLVPFVRAFGPDELVGRVAMLGIYGAFVAALFLLARSVAGARVAVLALAVCAVAPSFVAVSVTPLTQLPAAALLCAALWLALLHVEAPSTVRGALLGLALGALVLVRPSSVLLVGGALLWLVWRARARVCRSATVAALVGASLVVGAWTLEARHLTGRWLFVNNASSQNFYYGNNPWTPVYETWWFGSHKEGEPGVPVEFVAEHRRLAQRPPAERDRAFSRAAMEHVQERPALFVARSLARVRTFLAFDTFAGAQVAKKTGHPLVGLALVGVDGLLYVLVLALAATRVVAASLGAAEKLLLGAATLYAVPYFISFSHPTYHLPVVPLLAAIAGRQLDRVLRGLPWLPQSSPRRRRALAVVLLALGAIQVEWVVTSIARVS